MLESTPRVVTGIFRFQGAGYERMDLLHARLSYTVPPDKRAQLIYFRAGNSSPEMICLALLRNGQPMRFFPIGAKAAEHVSLAVVEDLPPDAKLEVFIAAPEGVAGTIALDMGLVEI